MSGLYAMSGGIYVVTVQLLAHTLDLDLFFFFFQAEDGIRGKLVT